MARQWLRLDNAAKIYPAARRKHWSNLFRVSVTLREEVDRPVLAQALEKTVLRFPSMVARMRAGLFWYYLEPADVPDLSAEYCQPLVTMTDRELRKCALRVIPYGKRIAVEVFHSLTDGNGAMVFLKTLTAEYLEQKYGISIPAEQGVLDREEPPRAEELEDSFLRHAAPVGNSRREHTAWHVRGRSGPVQVTCFSLSTGEVLEKAHRENVTITTYLAGCMLMALQTQQAQEQPNPRRRKPIKVLIPVNLRKLFGSQTLRNFVLYTTPELLPQTGWYDFSEICTLVKHHMGLTVTPKYMARMIRTNVKNEESFWIRMLPLAVKNGVMKAVFNAVGEKKSCLSFSNLGAQAVPAAMKDYVVCFDFILGVQATAPYNCGVVSFGDQLHMNIIRNIRQPKLEQALYRVLREQGFSVTVGSNGG